MERRRTVLPVLVGLMVLLALAVPVKAGPTVLWDQPKAFGWTAHSVYFASTGEAIYAADDFSNAGPWNIERIFIQGQVNYQGSLVNSSSLNWLIYPDAGGVPGGYPGTGGELWSHSCSGGASEVSISYTGGSWMYPEVTLDIVQAQGAPLYLPPGRYWLVFYSVSPNVQYFYVRHSAGTTNLAPAQIMSPTGYSGRPTTWTAWTTAYPVNSSHDLAFRLEGTFPPPPPGVKYLHSTGGWFNLTEPIGTQWHELWPVFCREYHLSSWNDTGVDGVLSYCDIIDMYEKPDGEVKWYHVEDVTITLNVTPGRDMVGFGFNGLPPPMFIELEGGYNASVLKNPIGTQWHEVYPVFCTTYNLTGWRDNGSKGLDYCDYILLRNKHTGEESEWHVEEVAIDIIVTLEPPPVGGEAYPVSKASLLLPWIALAVGVAGGIGWYVLSRRRAEN
jgi:hypothetical protein